MAAMSDVASPSSTASSDRLEAARAALARHDWTSGFALMSELDQEGDLEATDLERFAEAAFFAARSDAALDIKERAFKRHELDGDAVRAAYVAIDVGRTYGYAGKRSIASAWTRRAER